MTPEDLQRVQSLLESQEWIFAKTMPENPHHYTLRKKWQADADFVWTVQMIRAHGYTERYRGRPYIALNVGEFKYWTMGDTLPRTILINRKPVTAPIE